MRLIESSEERFQYRRVVESWVGTPFAAKAEVKGHGVDCVHLVKGVLQECGHAADYTLPEYQTDSGHSLSTSALLEWMRGSPHFEELENREEPEPGDVICFLMGKSAHHAGLSMGEGRFVHVFEHQGVRFGFLPDPAFKKRFIRPVAAFRPLR